MTSEDLSPQDATSLSDLREALTQLNPSGADGFEGLLAVIFSAIAHQDFRRAKSGQQGGKDGSTPASEITFEAKRYDNAIPKNEVLSKITQLIAGASPPNLWVLGATVEVGAQLVETLEAATQKVGISVLILDWPDASPLPPLAVACAMAAQETEAFLRTHLEDDGIVEKAIGALAGLKALEGFDARARRLEGQLRNPVLGIANARQANARWLEATFADRKRARSIFGQALAPSASHAMPTQDRQELVDHVQSMMSAAPAETIIALLGREGCGKSWLFAQAWRAATPRPLTLVIPAATFTSVTAFGDIDALITAKFIEQTGGEPSDDERRRWKTQLASWGPRQPEEAPRFVVCVDGLNERPDINWPRWLTAAASWIEDHGGLLIVTAREAYLNDRVRPSLISSVVPITVPAWTEAELTSILAQRGMDPAKLQPEVFERLRNPRLLGIAFELLDNAQVEAFAELSVDHLLFEHIRASARADAGPESADQFVKRLADHAREIIERVKQQKSEDRLVFEQDAGGGGGYELTSDLVAVTAEHFFQPLPEDPTLYTLPDDGLVLALGLAIIKALQTTKRSHRDIPEALDALLEPIEALDKTAEAVFAAVLVASVDPRCSNEIQRALITRVLGLQNLDQSHYPIFVAAIRKMPNAAMEALHDLAGTDDRVANQDWLIGSLRECRDRQPCWEIMSAHLQRWLRTYSLDPQLGVWPTRDDPEKLAEELARKTEKLRRDRSALPAAEEAFLASMQPVTLDPTKLHGPALELLAGKPLAPFAEALVACAFSTSFNSPIHDLHEELTQLVRFNRVDWRETRDAVLKAATFARAADASNTARWALVYLLRATCTLDDSDEEHALVEALTADRQKFEGWRLVEKYCETDPCDPEAATPANIDQTAARYAAINVNDLNSSLWMGEADHFLDAARPGLARFAPAAAIELHQRLARSLSDRLPLNARLALSELRSQSAIIDAVGLAALEALAIQHTKPYDGTTRDDREDWLVSQFALQILLPHLDGEQQVALLDRLPPHGGPLLDLLHVFQPSSPVSADRLLAKAVRSGERARILMALLYLQGTGVEIGQPSRQTVAKLMFAEDIAIRGAAMAVALVLDDRALIKNLVEHDWSAASLDPKQHFYEIWYGSHLLIRAVKLGLLDSGELLERISPKLFGAAVPVLPPDALATWLHQAMKRLIAQPIAVRPPIVEQEVPEAPETPGYLSLVETTQESEGPEAFFKRLSETSEEFDARQSAGWRAFRKFEQALTEEQARLAIENIGLETVETFTRTAPESASELATAIVEQSPGKMEAVVNFGLMLARCLSFENPLLAVELFSRLSAESPFVRLVFGPARVSLEAICVWGSSDCPEIQALRSSRLDSASNDQELAQEVLAALGQGKARILEEYAQRKLDAEVPAEVARGLMTLGFGDISSAAELVFQRYKHAKGFIGKAASTARYAYDRNCWARHWFTQMASAGGGEAFWRASVQFLKIVDGRVVIWAKNIERSDVAQRFAPLLKSDRKHRIEKWKSKREKTLFGSKVPAEAYAVRT